MRRSWTKILSRTWFIYLGRHLFFNLIDLFLSHFIYFVLCILILKLEPFFYCHIWPIFQVFLTSLSYTSRTKFIFLFLHFNHGFKILLSSIFILLPLKQIFYVSVHIGTLFVNNGSFLKLYSLFIDFYFMVVILSSKLLLEKFILLLTEVFTKLLSNFLWPGWNNRLAL
jgi:hypothetical protein